MRTSLRTGYSVILLALFLILPPVPRGPSVESKHDKRQIPQDISDPLRLLEEVVKRANAIGMLYHQLYRPTWEGANGAIGDAHLFAVTGDSGLYRLYTTRFSLLKMYNGGWVDDRAWACLAELTWWHLTGRKNNAWVEDAKKRYLEAKEEGRLSAHEGFWSWYNWPPTWKMNEKIFTNSNMNQMAHVACWLYEATKERQFYKDALLVWEGDANHPGIEKTYYRGNGRWEGKAGPAAFGKQLPWEGAEYCSWGAAMYRMTGNEKFKRIVVATARRIMDPANGWVDPVDFYQITMDGNGAFVHYLVDAYLIAPAELADIPQKIQKMLEHVWTNNHGAASVVLHRLSDDAIRNGWNPRGGEDGYGVDQVGGLHAQSQAARAFGVFAYALKEKITKRW